MPNIRQYDGPQGLGLQPTETGVDADLQAARRSGSFFNQQADAVQTVGNEEARMTSSSIRDAGETADKIATAQQMAHGAVAESAFTLQKTQELNDIVKRSDPNDPTVVPRFMEGLNSDLEKFKDGFWTDKGGQWAEQRTDALRSHFQTSAAAGMSEMAGRAAVANVTNMTSNWSNAAHADPSQVRSLLDHADQNIGAVIDANPNIDTATAARLKNDVAAAAKRSIVAGGANGVIEKASDPEKAVAAYSAQFTDYSDSAENDRLAKVARQQRSANVTDAERGRRLQTQAQQDQSDATETQYLQKLHDDNPQVQAQASAKAIVNDPSLTREAKERMVGVVNRELKPETDAKISAQTSVDIMRQMRDPNADLDKIKSAVWDARTKDPGTPGSLSKTDFEDLGKQIEDRKTPQGAALASDRGDFFKRYTQTIDPTANGGQLSALGSQKVYAAENDARRQEQLLRAQGQDPHSLYDPSSPNFFGKPANLSKYHVSLSDAQAYQVQNQKGSINLTANGPPTGIEVRDAPVIPAAEKRENDKVYQTPKGPAYWRGNGWELAK